MAHWLPPLPLLTAFLVASFVLAVTPGPGVMYVVTRSLAQGCSSGLASVAGVAIGNFGNAIAAAVGIGALLAVSSTAFLIVKYAGALYLVWLGIQALWAPRSETVAHIPQAVPAWPVFRDGFLVALLNPKTAIFFAAFLPQFMSPDAEPLVQSITLGALFVIIAGVTDTTYALTAASVAPLLLRTPNVRRAGRYLTGGTFIGLGILAAFSGSRPLK